MLKREFITEGGTAVVDPEDEVGVEDLDEAEEVDTGEISKTCIFTITRGARKGEPCGKKSMVGISFCSTHKPNKKKPSGSAPALKNATNPLPVHLALRKILPLEPIVITTDSKGRMFWNEIVLVPVKNLTSTDMNVGFAAVCEIDENEQKTFLRKTY